MTNAQAFDLALQRVAQAIVLRHAHLQADGKAATHEVLNSAHRSFGQIRRQAAVRAERARRDFNAGGQGASGACV